MLPGNLPLNFAVNLKLLGKKKYKDAFNGVLDSDDEMFILDRKKDRKKIRRK